MLKLEKYFNIATKKGGVMNARDEKLSKIVRLEAELFHRVYEGVLDPEEVLRKIQEILKSKLTSSIYPVTVDYGRSVEERVKAGCYD